MPLDPKALEAAARAMCDCPGTTCTMLDGADKTGYPAACARQAELCITAYLAAISETHVLVPRVATNGIFSKVIYLDDPSPDDLWHQILKTPEQPDGQ